MARTRRILPIDHGPTRVLQDAERGIETWRKKTGLGESRQSPHFGVLTAGISPATIHGLLSRLQLDSAVERFLPENVGLAAQQRVVDWEESEAFQILFNSNGIHIHIRDGGVPSEYENMRQNLVEELMSVTDPNGQPVFDEIYRREEIYEDRNVGEAPDVVLISRKYRYAINGTLLDCFRSNQHKNHKPNGIFFAAGPGIDAAELESAAIYDVAPTIAASVGAPVDNATDGTVLPIVSENKERRSWREMGSPYLISQENSESKDVKQRLADLGYME